MFYNVNKTTLNILIHKFLFIQLRPCLHKTAEKSGPHTPTNGEKHNGKHGKCHRPAQRQLPEFDIAKHLCQRNANCRLHKASGGHAFHKNPSVNKIRCPDMRAAKIHTRLYSPSAGITRIRFPGSNGFIAVISAGNTRHPFYGFIVRQPPHFVKRQFWFSPHTAGVFAAGQFPCLLCGTLWTAIPNALSRIETH